MSVPGSSLRPAQEQALAYQGGRLAIAAAPGAGKTFILTRLIVRLVSELGVRPDEILVLTYMRSAALNFHQRVAAELGRRGQTARGLRATTIHAFCQGVLRRELEAYDALEAHGDLDGSPEEDGGTGTSGAAGGAPGGGPTGRRLSVIGDAEQSAVLHAGLGAFLESSQRSPSLERALREGERSEVVGAAVAAARKAISAAKQAEFDVRAIEVPDATEVGFMARYYEDYLQARGLLDFDDMIGRTVRLLERQPEVLAYYHERIRFVLEDEAQDSTPLQNRLLELLAAGRGNLVRVGDPNQAILASFTSNDPRFFRAFCRSAPTIAMSESSRSARPILALANRLVALTSLHPDPLVREALGGDPILPASAGPANPTDAQLGWTVYPGKAEEIAGVLMEVRRHLREHPDHTCAILCYSNGMILKESDGTGFLPAARALGLDTRAEDPDRRVPAAQVAVFDHALALLDVTSPDPVDTLTLLAQARSEALGLPARHSKTGSPKEAEEGDLSPASSSGSTTPHRSSRQAPATGGKRVLDALRTLGFRSLVVPPALRPARPPAIAEITYAGVVEVAQAIERLLPMRGRPLGELLPAIAQELLGGQPASLLLAARLTAMSRDRALTPLAPPSHESERVSSNSPASSQVSAVRAVIAELRAGGNLDRLAVTPGEPEQPRAGQLIITTLHKSKGAEYDAVWIPNAGYYFEGQSNFPWLPSEVRAPELGALLAERAARGEPADPADTLAAHQRSLIAERLRLLYVGITRAKRRLALSCYSYGKRQAAPWHLLELARSIEAVDPLGDREPELLS